MRKKGQTTAATLVGIITLLFIFYILFLPPAEREELLGEGPSGEPGAVKSGEILIEANVGRLEIVPLREVDKSIPNTYLRELSQAKTIAEMTPFVIRKTLTKSDKKEFLFALADPEHTENVILSFAVPKREGTLKITLNGYEVFEGEIKQMNPPPVILRKSQLKESNTIVFEVMGIGLPSKEYDFTDIKIIGDVIDVTRMESKSTVPFADYEYSNLERAWIDFYPLCDQLGIGTLEISVNDKIMFSGVPSCDSPSRQDIFQEDIKPGKNIFGFKISKGNVDIEQIKLKVILKPTKGWNDFFTITPELYEDVMTGVRRIVFELEFIDDGKIKRSQINLNGRLDIIDQRAPVFGRDISNVIVKGNNYVEIMPLTQLDIVSLVIKAV